MKMSMPEEIELLLTPPEAAVVADVEVRDVHRMVDEEILPKDFYILDDGRRFRASACLLMNFYVHAADRLTSNERRYVIRSFAERTRTEGVTKLLKRWLANQDLEKLVVRDGFVMIDLADFARGATERLGRLAAARERVISDPDVLDGTPVIRGTRIPVYDIAASIAAGIPRERLRNAFSGLNDEVIDAAVLYAKAAPPRGRPRLTDRLKPGAKLLQSRTIPRHKA
jgi:uncharacterized protein (DUF433 family)